MTKFVSSKFNIIVLYFFGVYEGHEFDYRGIFGKGLKLTWI